VGCITRSTWDSAAVLEYIAGRDPFDDSTAFNKVEPYTKNLEEPNLEKRRIGVLKPYFCDSLHPEVSALFDQFTELLHSANAEIIYDLNIRQTNKFYDSWRDIRLAEAANVHRKRLNNSTTSYEYSNEVRQMLVAGTKIAAVDYILSMETVREIRNAFLGLISARNLDAFVVPTTIIPAPRFGQEKVNVGRNTILDTRQALLRNTIVFNSVGLPSVSIPIGLTKKDNLPLGAQIIGAPFKEETIHSIAYCYERINNSLSKFVVQS